MRRQTKANKSFTIKNKNKFLVLIPSNLEDTGYCLSDNVQKQDFSKVNISGQKARKIKISSIPMSIFHLRSNTVRKFSNLFLFKGRDKKMSFMQFSVCILAIFRQN